jgi:ABC-2 type transport system ATP-binding protein
MNLLEVRGLTKRYARTAAVDDLSFSVQPGQIFGFLGPNGSGKTTTLGMIFGVIAPTSGSIAIFGGSNRQALQRRRMSGTLEQPNLYPYLTGRENLKIVAVIRGLGDKYIEPALSAVDMLESADRVIKGYSLGMKQRLALAAAMLGEPEFLILDEPTNGLDPEGMREIRELLLNLSRSGRTILISTHLLDEVEKICTHVAILRRGRLQCCGSVADFTAGSTTFRVSAADIGELLGAIRQCEFAKNARTAGEAIYVELTADGPARLNRYLADRGIYLGELTNQRQTLEQAFLAVTGIGSGPTDLEGQE